MGEMKRLCRRLGAPISELEDFEGFFEDFKGFFTFKVESWSGESFELQEQNPDILPQLLDELCNDFEADNLRGLQVEATVQDVCLGNFVKEVSLGWVNRLVMVDLGYAKKLMAVLSDASLNDEGFFAPHGAPWKPDSGTAASKLSERSGLGSPSFHGSYGALRGRVHQGSQIHHPDWTRCGSKGDAYQL